MQCIYIGAVVDSSHVPPTKYLDPEEKRMKRSMKRVLAMIFTIIMVLGLVPFKSEEVEAANASFKSSILYIEEFKDENASLKTDINNYTKASLGKSVKSTVSTYRVSNSPKEKFIDV